MTPLDTIKNDGNVDVGIPDDQFELLDEGIRPANS